MNLADVVKESGTRLWVKSEWGPAGSDWPAVSFSKRSVGDYLRQEFRPGRDFIVYIGTSSATTTENPAHRQRLLSSVSIEPMQILETRECVPNSSWEIAQSQFRGRWQWSMPALEIYEFDEFPSAHDVLPSTYSQLGLIPNRGRVVEIAGSERDAVLQLSVHDIAFQRPVKAQNFSRTRQFLNLDAAIRQDIGKMAANILARVAASGNEHTGTNPVRKISEPDLHLLLGEKWSEQEGRCFLCSGPLIPNSKNYLLQSSPDRTDSTNNEYGRTNTQITHLGCNLAKNKVTLEEFEDWLAVVKGDAE
jgi:hypothetical protein